MPTIPKPIYKPRKNEKRDERNKVYQSSLWKRLRLAKLRDNPLCEVCMIENKITLAKDCHHLISFLEASNEIERDKLAYDYNNLLSTCKYHHSEIHNGYLKGCKTLDDIRKRIEENKKK